MDAPRTVTLGEALARAAAAGEPIQQKEATAIFLEALRLADQTQASLSSAGALLREDGSLELAPGSAEAGARDPFAPVSGAYELADELFRGAAPLALGRGDGTRAAPFATLRDLLCSLEFHLLVESGRGGPPPPARADCRRAILRLLAVKETAGPQADRPAAQPEARRDLIRTFEQVAAAKREAGEPLGEDKDDGRGVDRAPARSAIEWPEAVPSPAAAAAPPAAAAPASPPAAAPASPPAAAPAPVLATPQDAGVAPPAIAPARAAPGETAGAAVEGGSSTAAATPGLAPGSPANGVRRAVVLALIVGASLGTAVAVSVRRPAARSGAAADAASAPEGAPAAETAHPPEVAVPAGEVAGPPAGAAALPPGGAGALPTAAEPMHPGAPAPGPEPAHRVDPAPASRKRAPADPAAEARAHAKVRLGEGLLKAGQVFQALVAFREADQEVPLAESARRLGDIYRLQHDDALAAASYRRCLRLSPSPADAREVRAILDELRRAPPPAE